MNRKQGSRCEEKMRGEGTHLDGVDDVPAPFRFLGLFRLGPLPRHERSREKHAITPPDRFLQTLDIGEVSLDEGESWGRGGGGVSGEEGLGF